jgi:hypothetical protein
MVRSDFFGRQSQRRASGNDAVVVPVVCAVADDKPEVVSTLRKRCRDCSFAGYDA